MCRLVVILMAHPGTKLLVISSLTIRPVLDTDIYGKRGGKPASNNYRTEL